MLGCRGSRAEGLSSAQLGDSAADASEKPKTSPQPCVTGHSGCGHRFETRVNARTTIARMASFHVTPVNSCMSAATCRTTGWNIFKDAVEVFHTFSSSSFSINRPDVGEGPKQQR